MTDAITAERDLYRRALESITKTGHQDIVRELTRIDEIAVDALIEGDALRKGGSDD